jgi:hypothetical protein
VSNCQLFQVAAFKLFISQAIFNLFQMNEIRMLWKPSRHYLKYAPIPCKNVSSCYSWISFNKFWAHVRKHEKYVRSRMLINFPCLHNPWKGIDTPNVWIQIKLSNRWCTSIEASRDRRVASTLKLKAKMEKPVSLEETNYKQ